MAGRLLMRDGPLDRPRLVDTDMPYPSRILDDDTFTLMTRFLKNRVSVLLAYVLTALDL